MRSRLALILLATAVGCDSGGGGGKSPDLSVSNKDMTMMVVNCDVVKQDCGAGKKCVAAFDGSGGASGSCIADGTLADGATCTIASDPTTILDDACKAGTTCDDIIGSGPVCRKYCAADTDCASGQKCGDFTAFYGLANPPGFGWCVPNCDPFGANTCASGYDCGEDWYGVEQADPTQPASGFFFCKKTGAGHAYAPCADANGGPSDALCGAGLWCNDLTGNGDYFCMENCDNTHTCTMPPGDAGGGGIGAGCVAFDNTPNGEGYCYQM